MTETRGNALTRGLRAIGRGLNRFRIIVLNLVFFFLFFLVLGALLSERSIPIEDGIALVMAPQGALVEQYTGDPVSRAVDRALGAERREARMRDLLLAINEAAMDERIKALVVVPDQIMGAGLAQLQELAQAIDAFKQSGKPVYAYGDYYTQEQYYLAAPADEVFMHPDGLLFLEGFARMRAYFKTALDKLAVDVHLFRVGEYKSAAEPFIRDTMSPAAREANLSWLNDLWDGYVTGVAEARGMNPTLVRDYVNRFGARLQSTGGRAAQAAVEANLVDALSTRDEFRAKLIELVGEDEEHHSFRQINAERYAQAQRRQNLMGSDEDTVAVIVAQGPIVAGKQPPGTIGAETLSKKIRQVRYDEDVDALVFRVDSGGGSAFASELIRRELALTRMSGMPVVVSMGTVAASGGYWIATPADRIYASPTTITGSIGVFGLFLNFPRTLEKIGVNVDGVGTTSLAGAFHPGEPLDPQAARIVQQLVEQTYEEFITLVAEARDLDKARVQEIAQGRVWSGKDAARFGLVDELGGLNEAIAAAAELAELEDYRVDYIERELSPFEQWLVNLSTQVLARTGLDLGARLPSWLANVGEELQLFTGAGADPQGLYAYCFCTPR